MTPAVRSRPGRTGGIAIAGITAAVTSVFVLLMLLTTVQGTPQFRAVPQPQATRTVTPEPLPTQTAELVEPPDADQTVSVVTVVIWILLGILVTALVGWLLVAILRAVRRAWEERPLPERAGAEIATVPGADAGTQAQPDAAVIQRGIAAALQRIAEPGAPGDAIVAAWVGVEEAAADSGVVRGMSETAGEFAVRIVARRSVIDADARDLLSLYERVRFGGYQAIEADRARARRLLARIEQEWR